MACIPRRWVCVDRFPVRQGVIGRRSVEPGGKPKVAVEEVQAGDGEPLKRQLESFLHAIRSESRPVVSGEEGVAALELAHRVLSAMGVSLPHKT